MGRRLTKLTNIDLVNRFRAYKSGGQGQNGASEQARAIESCSQ